MKHDKIEANCPMDALLRLISGPWTSYLVWTLSTNGPVRFGKLKRLIPGISSRMLTERLRKLEESGLVVRDYKPTIPPEVSYALTERGLELSKALGELNTLAIKWGMAEPCEV